MGVGKSERASVAGAAEHGLEAPREVHVAAQGDGPSPNARRGTTLPVAKLAAGGPRVASRLGDPDPAGNSATPDAGKARKASANDAASSDSDPHQEKRYDCEAIVSQAVRNAAARSAANKPHSPAFSEFVERFGKKTAYCGAETFPCEESYRREIILLRNMRHIEQHNAARAEPSARAG